MLRSVALPLLPGNSFDNNIGKTKFHRSQHFEHCKNIPVLSEKIKPGIGGVPLYGTKRVQKYPSIFTKGEATDLPAWITFDKQVMCFDAFFQETVQERRNCPFQIRKCKIYFYLEDGTIQVLEPKVGNSGIPQGTLLSRQRIPFPAPRQSEFFDIIDFNIGRQVELFSRVFKITNCDRFTRVFLNRLGIAVPDPINTPQDPYTVDRAKMSDGMQPKKPNAVVDTLGQFLENDRRVLRFYGYWDDRESDYGFLHNLEVHYFLADDTVELREVIPPNSGRESGFMFCRRAKLPKYFSDLPTPGHDSLVTLLNVMSYGKAHYILDPLNCGKESTEYYRENDLAIGACLNVYGRQVMLTDCDPFTKEYYRAKYGLDDFTPAEHPKVAAVVLNPMESRPLPPYNGYGSFADSAANCLKVLPIAPNRDFSKFLKKDRQGLDSYILRFKAQMISKIPENNERLFIFMYYLCDDTISVYENVKRNSGFIRGEFFSRNKMYKPGQELYSSKEPNFYTDADCFVGNILVINDFVFMLMDADEYCLRYMEINCHEFPKSNIHLILEKLRQALKPIYKEFVSRYLQTDPCQCGVVSYCKMRKALKEILGDQITEHEMITIARYYNAKCKTEIMDRETLRSIIHTEMKRFLFDQMERLLESFHHLDPDRTCHMERNAAYAICRGSKIPIDKDLLNAMLNKIQTNECGQLNYMDLMQFLDFKNCPATSSLPLNHKVSFNITSEPSDNSIGLVDYDTLLKDLNLEQTVVNQSG